MSELNDNCKPSTGNLSTFWSDIKKPGDVPAQEPSPNGVLEFLLSDLLEEREGVKRALQLAPEELPAHRVNVMYVDRILDILKARQLHKSVDRDRLLIESLQTVVQFLLEKGEKDCARVLGDHLETLGNRVKRLWKLSDSLPSWPTAIPESGPPSPVVSPPSATTASAKRKEEKTKG